MTHICVYIYIFPLCSLHIIFIEIIIIPNKNLLTTADSLQNQPLNATATQI